MIVFAWKCKTCGCLWRDNLDDTVSLFDAKQQSCLTCEHQPTKDACLPTGVPFEARVKAVPEHAYLTSKLAFLTERAEALLNECDVNALGVYFRHGFNDMLKKLKAAVADPELAPLLRPAQEVCICAALRFLDRGKPVTLRGHRHDDCILNASKRPNVLPNDVALGVQGFMTSHNRFVDRFEGMKLQRAAGWRGVDGVVLRGDMLFSEDLY